MNLLFRRRDRWRRDFVFALCTLLVKVRYEITERGCFSGFLLTRELRIPV